MSSAVGRRRPSRPSSRKYGGRVVGLTRAVEAHGQQPDHARFFVVPSKTSVGAAMKRIRHDLRTKSFDRFLSGRMLPAPLEKRAQDRSSVGERLEIRARVVFSDA